MDRKKFCDLLVLVLIFSFIPGCTTMRPVMGGPAQIADVVQPGDEVRVLTRNGRELTFTVKSVDQTRIVGETAEVPMADVAQLERRQFSLGRTLGVAVGAVIVTVIAWGVYFFATFRP